MHEVILKKIIVERNIIVEKVMIIFLISFYSTAETGFHTFFGSLGLLLHYKLCRCYVVFKCQGEKVYHLVQELANFLMF